MSLKHISISCAAILVAVAALVATVSGQSPSKVLKQAEKALGGQKQLKAVASMSRSGTITRLSDGASGRYISQTSGQNLINVSFDIAGFETETGYNGRSAWARDSREGLRTLTGRESSQMQAKAQYRNHLWLEAKNEKLKLVYGGPTTIDGKRANIVTLTNPKGVAVKVYFDAVSGLPLRDEVSNGNSIEITDYGDYRDVGGVKQPFTNRITVGNEKYEIRFDDIRPNAQIARSEFDFPNLSTEPLPDITALLRELQANEDRVDGLLDHYAYTQRAADREIGKDGVLRETGSETTQISFYKGNRIARQIEKNGKPLSSGDQEKEDKNAAKQVEGIEKKIAKQQARAAKGEDTSEEDRRISIAEVLRASKLQNPRRERFRGREVIVFDFEPNPAFDMKNAKSMLKFFGKTAGVMWIDEKDKQVARIEAVLAQSFGIGGGVLAKLQKGATFTLEKERVGDEIWLPSLAEVNLSVRVLLVKGINVNQLIRYYDYRRFETEVTDATVDEKKP
jgi:hypothetical protein